MSERLGSALMPADDDGRSPLWGIYGVSDDGTVLTLQYEGYRDNCGTTDRPAAYLDQPAADFPRALFTVEFTRYRGQENTTPDLVERYLMTNYRANGQAITPRYARELVRGNPAVADAMTFASFAYYPGDKIAEQLGFDYIPDEDAEPTEDED